MNAARRPPGGMQCACLSLPRAPCSPLCPSQHPLASPCCCSPVQDPLNQRFILISESDVPLFPASMLWSQVRWRTGCGSAGAVRCGAPPWGSQPGFGAHSVAQPGLDLVHGALLALPHWCPWVRRRVQQHNRELRTEARSLAFHPHSLLQLMSEDRSRLDTCSTDQEFTHFHLRTTQFFWQDGLLNGAAAGHCSRCCLVFMCRCCCFCLLRCPFAASLPCWSTCFNDCLLRHNNCWPQAAIVSIWGSSVCGG